jgi:hypothetical protein
MYSYLNDNIISINITKAELEKAFTTPQKFVDFYAKLRIEAGIPLLPHEKEELLELILKGEEE